MPRRGRPPATPKIPARHPCTVTPGCVVRIQRGRGPGGLAWHDCLVPPPAVADADGIGAALASPEPLTPAKAEDLLLRLLLRKAMKDGSTKDITAALEALRVRAPTPRGETPGTGSTALLEFLNAEVG